MHAKHPIYLCYSSACPIYVKHGLLIKIAPWYSPSGLHSHNHSEASFSKSCHMKKETLEDCRNCSLLLSFESLPLQIEWFGEAAFWRRRGPTWRMVQGVLHVKPMTHIAGHTYQQLEKNVKGKWSTLLVWVGQTDSDYSGVGHCSTLTIHVWSVSVLPEPPPLPWYTKYSLLELHLLNVHMIA